jgi:hypothetical protein
MRFINLSLTTPTPSHLCLQVMSYISTSLDLLFIFVRSSSSLGRMPHCQQVCSVLRRVYLVIPQVGTRYQQTSSVSRWVSLLNHERLALHPLRFYYKIAYGRRWGNSSETIFFFLFFFLIGMVFMLEDEVLLYSLVVFLI